MKKTVEYVVVLADGVRKRHRHEMERDQILTFVVQLEMLIGQSWLPVVRYERTNTMTDYQRFASLLEREFSGYLQTHEGDADQFPANALVIFQVDGEPEFNRWHRDLSLRHREGEQPVVEVHVRHLRSASLLEDVNLVSV